MAVIKSDGDLDANFTMVSNDLARTPDISLRTKGVYIYLRSHSQGWSMSTDRIADALNVSRSTVARAVSELEEHGYLGREQTKSRDGRFSETCYVVHSVPRVKYDQRAQPAETASIGRSLPLVKYDQRAHAGETGERAGHTVCQKTDNGVLTQHKKTNSSKKTKRENQEDYCAPAGARESGSRYPKDFEDWYRLWPRKKSKGDALKAFKAAKKKITVQELMERTRAITEAWHLQGKDPQFIPYPASWLRADGWEDDITEPPKRNSNSFLEFSQALRSVTDDQRAIS